jgi:hypothetical protein
MGRVSSVYLLFSALAVSVTHVSGLGSQCSAPLGSGSAGSNDPVTPVPHRASSSSTARNLAVSDAATAIKAHWNCGTALIVNFAFFTQTETSRVLLSTTARLDVTVGSNADDGQQVVEVETIIDAVVLPIFQGLIELQGSIVLNNIKLNNVATAVGVAGGATVLAGGTKTNDNWTQGSVYSGSSSTENILLRRFPRLPRSWKRLEGSTEKVAPHVRTRLSAKLFLFVTKAPKETAIRMIPRRSKPSSIK